MKKNTQILFLTAVLLSLLSFQANAQTYSFTLIQNSDFNYTIAAVPDFDSGIFSPITQSYGFVIVLPDGITITVDEYLPTGANGTETFIDGANVVAFDPDMSDNDLYLITTDTAGLTFSPHTAGTIIPLVTLNINSSPATGEIRILDNNSTLASAPALNGSLDAFIQVDVIDDASVVFSNQFNALTGTVNFSFNTLSTIDIEFTKLSIYPNPSKGFIYIKGNTNTITQIEIYNINGQLVKIITSNFERIDLNQLESAVYFMKLYSNITSKTIKLIKI